MSSSFSLKATPETVCLRDGETEFQDDPIQVIAGRLIVPRFLWAV